MATDKCDALDEDFLINAFEAERSRLRRVAYRILGSFKDVDDVLQEAWLRMDASDAAEVQNVPGWMTTVVARLSLNVLRSRRSRGEEPASTYVPDPEIRAASGTDGDPEHRAMQADSVGLAMLVVLEVLSPPERVAFVLHDMFSVGFDEIATVLERSPEAARQLASRARRRVQQEPRRGDHVPRPVVDATRQRTAMRAFFAAARAGDLEGLLRLLHPEVVLRADGGQARPATSILVQGAQQVASRALMFSRADVRLVPVVANGDPAVIGVVRGRPQVLMVFTVEDDRVVAIHVVQDPVRLESLGAVALANGEEPTL